MLVTVNKFRRFIKILMATILLYSCHSDLIRDFEPPYLSFDKLVIESKNDTITVNQIFDHLSEENLGFTLVSIDSISNPDMAELILYKKGILLKKVGKFTANLILDHPSWGKQTLRYAEFEWNYAPKLTFDTIEVDIEIKKVIFDSILSHVKGDKEGYILDTIINISNDNVKLIRDSNNLQLVFNDIGNYTADLVLKHPRYKDVTISKAVFKAIKADTKPLVFNKLIKSYIPNQSFTTADILANIQGIKQGYTLKEIRDINPTEAVSVLDEKPNLSLKYNQIGSFTATLVLEHATKQDVTINLAEFEITKGNREVLTFNKFVKNYILGGSISKSEILAHIQGAKTGYSIKEIRDVNPLGIVTVSSDGERLDFINGKVGNFIATIVLEHPTKQDVTLSSSAFEITKYSSGALTFDKLKKDYILGGSISQSEILAHIQGAKTGYSIKEIRDVNPLGIVTVSSDGMGLDFINGKVGSFMATLVLEHATKQDVTLSSSAFEITKNNREVLTFNKLVKNYILGGSISQSEILAHIQGAKTGYSIKEIRDVNPLGIVTVSSDGMGLDFVNGKIDSFTATLVLEHATKQDVVLSSSAFEIIKGNREVLTFNKLVKNYILGGSISQLEILAHIQGAKTGYSIKEIRDVNPLGIVAVSSDGIGLDFVNGKAGSFTATLVLEHATKQDVTVSSSVFEIIKGNQEVLTFNKLRKDYVLGEVFQV